MKEIKLRDRKSSAIIPKWSMSRYENHPSQNLRRAVGYRFPSQLLSVIKKQLLLEVCQVILRISTLLGTNISPPSRWFSFPEGEILLMEEILHQLRLVVYPIIYKVSYIQVVVWDVFRRPYVGFLEGIPTHQRTSVPCTDRSWSKSCQRRSCLRI